MRLLNGYWRSEKMENWNFEDWDSWGYGMDIAHHWADYAKSKGRIALWKFKDLLSNMISDGYDDDWGQLETELEEQFLKEGVEGNPYSSEIYCLFHAFVKIGQLEGIDEKEHKFWLVCKHWDFFRFLYSVMLLRVVGCGFTNFASVGNNLKITPSYHPYLHLFYSAIMGSKEEICCRGTKREKLDRSLADLREIIVSTPRSEELDELCQILFPDKWKKYMATHRLRTYRELEEELKRINAQIITLAEQLSNTISVDVIAQKLLDLPPQTARAVFLELNAMLMGNKAWVKIQEELYGRILARTNNSEMKIGHVDQLIAVAESNSNVTHTNIEKK